MAPVTTTSTVASDTRKSGTARLAGYAVSLVSAILVSRMLGPDGKGLLSLGTAIPGLAAVVAGLGMGTATTIAAREGWLPYRAALSVLITYTMAIGAFACAVTVAMSKSGWFGSASGSADALAAAASIGGLLLADYSAGVLQGAGAVARGMWVRQAVGIGQSAIVVILVAVGVRDPLPLFVGMAIWAWACAVAGTAAVIWGGWATIAPEDRTWLRRMAVVGMRTQAVWILLMLNYRLDMVLLGALGSIADVGVYSIAVGFSEVAWFGANALGSVLLPHVSSVGAALARARTARAIRLSVASTLLLAGLVALGLSVSAGAVFGEGFRSSSVAFLALVPGLVAFAVFKMLAIHDVARRNTLWITVLALIGIALNVATNVVLIPRFGSVGAGLASSVSYTAISIVAAARFLRGSGLSTREALIPARADWVTVMSGGRAWRAGSRVD